MKKTIFHRCFVVLLSAIIAFSSSMAWAASEFSRAWKSPNSSIVLDAYEYTVIDWSKIKNNQRLAGFINKATEGLRPRANCKRNSVCRLRWRRYAAAKELYHTRKTLAKTLGLKWGAYHLGRPGNPIKQARHFLEFARPGPDDLVAIDIEENNPQRWMSLQEAEIFAQYIYERLGRYPVLYTNHSTARYIAQNRAELPLLSRLNLWYARYRPSMKGAFPMGNWDSYTIWQFSAHTNCSPQSCLWRIAGTDHWIDVNVVNMSPAELRRKWPFNELTGQKPAKNPEKVAPLPQFVADALVTTPDVDAEPATLTGYAKKPKVISAAKMFKALLSKPKMAWRGEVPLPTFHPAAATKPALMAATETKPLKAAATAAETVTVTVTAKNSVGTNVTAQLAKADVVGEKPDRALIEATAKPAPKSAIDKNTVPLQQAQAEPKLLAKKLVAQISRRNSEQVNALLLETAKSYLEASQNGAVAWHQVAAATTKKDPVAAKKASTRAPHWRPDTQPLLEDGAVDLETERQTKPINLKESPTMAVGGPVVLPRWRPGTKVAEVVLDTAVPKPDAEPSAVPADRPTVAPVMAIKGTVVFPTWRPQTKLAKAPTVELTRKDAPKMAISGQVAKPNWRPGAKIKRVVLNAASDVVELAASSGYLIPTSAGDGLRRQTALPTWRPDSILPLI